jgi:hypothetical protein
VWQGKRAQNLQSSVIPDAPQLLASGIFCAQNGRDQRGQASDFFGFVARRRVAGGQQARLYGLRRASATFVKTDTTT